MSGDYETLVLDGDGRQLLSIAAPATAARLSGSDLVFPVGGELRHYAAATGALLHSWSFSGELQDAAPGVVSYLVDGKLNLLRFRDGARAVVANATAARFGDTGLFYAYEAAYPWRGRIRFVPFDRLPLS